MLKLKKKGILKFKQNFNSEQLNPSSAQAVINYIDRVL